MLEPTAKPERERPTYVYVRRPRCPDCGGVRLLAYRSVKQGDGTVTRYVRCSGCGRRVVLIIE